MEINCLYWIHLMYLIISYYLLLVEVPFEFIKLVSLLHLLMVVVDQLLKVDQMDQMELVLMELQMEGQLEQLVDLVLRYIQGHNLVQQKDHLVHHFLN